MDKIIIGGMRVAWLGAMIFFIASGVRDGMIREYQAQKITKLQSKSQSIENYFTLLPEKDVGS